MLIGRKSEESITQGYVFAPYIPLQTTDIVVDYFGRKTMRKSKISRIFDLNIDIKCESPTSIVSRYTKKVLSKQLK